MNMKTEMTSVARRFPQRPQVAITFNVVESETKHMNVLEKGSEVVTMQKVLRHLHREHHCESD